MKKVISILVLLMLSISISAASQWHTYNQLADKLRGLKEGINYIYENGTNFFSFSTRTPNVFLISFADEYEMFETFESTPDDDDLVANGLVGFYDEDGQYLRQYNIRFKLWKGFNYAIPIDADRWMAREIISWIRNYKGYIRIIVPKVNTDDFDITVENLKNLP